MDELIKQNNKMENKSPTAFIVDQFNVKPLSMEKVKSKGVLNLGEHLVKGHEHNNSIYQIQQSFLFTTQKHKELFENQVEMYNLLDENHQYQDKYNHLFLDLVRLNGQKIGSITYTVQEIQDTQYSQVKVLEGLNNKLIHHTHDEFVSYQKDLQKANESLQVILSQNEEVNQKVEKICSELSKQNQFEEEIVLLQNKYSLMEINVEVLKDTIVELDNKNSAITDEVLLLREQNNQLLVQLENTNKRIMGTVMGVIIFVPIIAFIIALVV